MRRIYFWVALIRKYIYMGIYMWKYLACNLEPRFTFCIYNCGVGLKWNSCAGTLTTKHVARLVTLYMRERMYAIVYAVRSNFPRFVRTYGTCMNHDKSLFHTCIVPHLIKLLLGYMNPIHYDFVSWELHHVVGTDGSTCWKWGFPVDVWYSYPTLESLALCGVLRTAPLIGTKYTWRDNHGIKYSWPYQFVTKHPSGRNGRQNLKEELLGRLPK